MTTTIFTIISNERIAKSVYKMILSGNASEITRAGQFVNIKLDGFYLRRPISVCDCSDDTLTIIYKAVGKGTEYMATLKSGQTLDILLPLGNGYSLDNGAKMPLILGGGVGVPPMYNLAKRLIHGGASVTAVLGFNTADEVFYADEFAALGANVIVTTADGSVGEKGFVTDVMDKIDYDYLYCCGPEPMLKAVYNKSQTSGQFSFEERMGCGFGACMGCSCKTKYGNKRICKDGPVLTKEEIIW